ncbi:T9SS type A sorting domain-containing protein [Fibrobacterota bacterium]
MFGIQIFSQDKGANYIYAVVISEAAYADGEWKEVADALLAKHDTYDARMFKWSSSVTDVKSQLSEFMPHYIGFIARPVTECNEPFIESVYEMCRDLDDDIYGDAVWGVITGYEAADALRAIDTTVLIKTLISGNGNEEEWDALQGIGFLELESGNHVRYKFSDGRIHTMVNPDFDESRVTNISNLLNDGVHIEVDGYPTIDGQVDLLTTSGHGNINHWMAPNDEGSINSQDGTLKGLPSGSSSIPINSPNPKCYCAHGNCRVANPNNIDNMVYGWFHSGGAINMFGYMPNTYFGYMGWGFLDRLRDLKGYNSYPETFYITNQCLHYDIINNAVGQSVSDLEYDRDTTVMYGDPKSDARLYCFDPLKRPYKQEFEHIKVTGAVPDTFVYTVTCNFDFDFSWWPGFVGARPFHFLPVRIDASSVNIESHNGEDAVITDNFVLFEAWKMSDSPKTGDVKSIRWTALVTDSSTGINNHSLSSGKNNFKKNILRVTANTICFTALLKGCYSIDIYNSTGRNVAKIGKAILCNSGTNSIPWNTRVFSNGVYIIRISGKNMEYSQKFIVRK